MTLPDRLILLAAAGLAGCFGGNPVDEPEALTSLVVDVHYEQGAEPYTGNVGPGQGDTWDLFATNSAALFVDTDITITSPSTLGEMTQFAAGGVESYTVNELLDLARDLGSPGQVGDERTIVALWLDARLDVDGQPSDSVLGVSIGETSVIAMFKPVIESISFAEPVRRFGEQAVVIHEFGHAIGLVNNGVPNLTDHHDAENGAHCTNDECVMYWANEGIADLADFVQQVALTGDSVIFDDDCLDDTSAHYAPE